MKLHMMDFPFQMPHDCITKTIKVLKDIDVLESPDLTCLGPEIRFAQKLCRTSKCHTQIFFVKTGLAKTGLAKDWLSKDSQNRLDGTKM